MTGLTVVVLEAFLCDVRHCVVRLEVGGFGVGVAPLPHHSSAGVCTGGEAAFLSSSAKMPST